MAWRTWILTVGTTFAAWLVVSGALFAAAETVWRRFGPLEYTIVQGLVVVALGAAATMHPRHGRRLALAAFAWAGCALAVGAWVVSENGFDRDIMAAVGLSETAVIPLITIATVGSFLGAVAVACLPRCGPVPRVRLRPAQRDAPSLPGMRRGDRSARRCA